MHKNRLFLGILLFSAFTFLWYAVAATRAFLVYIPPCQESYADFIEAKVEESGANHFRLLVNLSFNNNQIQARMGDYPNRFVAEGRAKRLKEMGKISVWYDPKDPSHVLLERKFPTRPLLSAMSLLGVTVYLFFLGQYVSKRK